MMNNRPSEVSDKGLKPMETALYERSIELLKEVVERQEGLLYSLERQMAFKEPRPDKQAAEIVDAEFEEEATMASMINHQIDKMQMLAGRIETLCSKYHDQVGNIKILKL